jgi:hypothetical protein
MAARRRARAKSAVAKDRADPSQELRRIAGLLYIQDKDGHSYDWHWENSPARSKVSLGQYMRWAREDGWYEQRIEYWRDVQYRTLEQMKPRDVARVVQAVDRLDDYIDAVDKMLSPMRDKAGKILRDENGLPCFHLALPPYDRMVKVALDLDARRDHYGERIMDHVIGQRAGNGAPVQQGQIVDMETQLTAEEARDAARWLLLRRHKRLAADAQHDEDVQKEDGDG